MDARFLHDTYLLRRQVLALTGKFRIYSPQGTLVVYSEQRMFRLKEDIRLYGDEAKSSELLRIQARQIIDFSAAYDVVDSASGLSVGTLRRRGFHSLVQDSWEVLDPAGQTIASLGEDDLTLALLRRLLLGSLLPQRYGLRLGDRTVAEFRQRFHLFRYDLELDFRADPSRQFDRRMGIAAAVLLATIEGKQNG
jgi:uncharacterized protein YxjI